MERLYITQIIIIISNEICRSLRVMISSHWSRNTYLLGVCNISAVMPHADQLYSSRGRGKWVDKPYVIRLAPDGWKDKHSASAQTENLPDDHETDIDVASAESRASWARLIRKIYEGCAPRTIRWSAKSVDLR